MSLIERFYDALEGRVLADGVDLRDLNVRWWRQQIGFVQQEPLLFPGSIRENIIFGMYDSTSLLKSRSWHLNVFFSSLSKEKCWMFYFRIFLLRNQYPYAYYGTADRFVNAEARYVLFIIPAKFHGTCELLSFLEVCVSGPRSRWSHCVFSKFFAKGVWRTAPWSSRGIFTEIIHWVDTVLRSLNSYYRSCAYTFFLFFWR